MKIDMRNILGQRYYQFLAAFTGSLGILSSEMHFGWPSPSLPILTNGTYFFQVTSEEASWLAVTLFPGIAVGAVLSSRFADILGRKIMILATSVPLFFSWLIIALARNDMWLFAARFLAGVGSGVSFAIVPMYLGEISDPKIRGLISSLCPVFVVMGILFINILGLYLTIDVAAYISCTIPVLMFLTFVWMPESPMYYLRKKQPERAKKVLNLLRGEEKGAEEFERLIVEFQRPNKSDENPNKRFLNLITIRENRKALIITLGLRGVQQLCGSTAITFYCKTIFQETEGFMSPNVGTIIFFSLQAAVSVLSSFIVDILGRRILLLISLLGTTVTLFTTGLYLYLKTHAFFDMQYLNFAPFLSLFLNIMFFSIGIRNIPLLVMSEIFHPSIKSLALCFVTIYYGLLAVLVTKYFHLTVEYVELSCPFFTFGVLSFFSLFFIYYYVPETMGKTLEEIQLILKGDKSVKTKKNTSNI